MAFPQTQLDLRVELQLAGVWTNITGDVRVDQGVEITRGRADEAGRPDAQTCKLKLRNRDGRYSPRNPASPYYGILGRNVPLRVGIGTPPAGAASASSSASTSLVAPSVTAETAGRIISVWGASPVGDITVPGGFTAGTERDGTLSTWQRGTKTVTAGATGTATATFSTSATAQAAMSVFVPGASVAIAASYSSIYNDPASTHTSPFTVPVNAGDYVLVFHGWSSDPHDDMRRPPFLSQARSPAWVLVADSGPGNAPRLQAWALRVEAATTLSLAVDGIANIDDYARVEVLTGVTDYLPRFLGEVSTWPVTWDLAGADVATPITASGVRRRLTQSDDASSAMRREVLNSSGVVAYWPMEDGTEATSFGSAAGGHAMACIGTPQLAADSSFTASSPLPTFNGAGAKGVVPAHTSTNKFSVGFLVSVPSGTTDEATILTITTSGSARTWTIKYETGASGFRIEAWDADGSSLENLTIGPWTIPAAGGRFYLLLAVQASGSNITWSLTGVQIQADGTWIPGTAGDSITGATVGRVTSVQVGAGPVPLNQPLVVGHIGVAPSTTALASNDLFAAASAWTNRTAPLRLRDLGRRANTFIGVQGAPVLDNGVPMGPQLPKTFMELMDEAADTDGGVLVEPKGYLGFQYRTRSSKLSQTPWLTLDYRTPGHVGHPLEPVDDDQATVNDVTVTRVGGASARVEQTTGPLSTAAPPAGVGRYSVAAELALFSDDDAADKAAWLLHLGTWDEARWPTILTRLHAAPALITAMCALDVGDVITLTGLPSWVPPGPTQLMLEGYTETLMPFSWDFAGNYSPAGPWRAGIADSGVFGRADSEGSTLAADATSSAGTLSVATAAGHALWIQTATHPTEFPFDIKVAGEQMTVTGITGATSPQTFAVTRSVNGVVKAQVTGAQVRLADPVYVA